MKAIIKLQREYHNALRVGWFLAIRHIRRSSKGTTGLIVFIMVLTFLNLVVVSGLLLGLITGSFQQFRDGYSGEVIVTPAPGHDEIDNSRGLVSFLTAHPRVYAISPRYGTDAMVLGTLDELPKKDERPNQGAARLTGIDITREEVVTRFSRFVTFGEHLEPGEHGYILLGANLVKKYSAFADANVPGLDMLTNVDVGSRVRVSIGKNGASGARKDFIVKGIVKSKIDELSTRAFIVDAELKNLLPAGKDDYREVAIKTDLAFAPHLVREIEEFMGEHDARVQTSQDAIPSFLRDIETTMGVLGNALSSFALVVASITVFIVVFINAITKRKFIGIMKGIGISPLAVEFSYIFQALFYGLTGSGIGLLLTFGVLRPYFTAHPIDFPFSDGILVATAWGAGIRVAILLGVTLIAGYIPAKLIVRKNTLDAILGR